jgi:predicted ATPase
MQWNYHLGRAEYSTCRDLAHVMQEMADEDGQPWLSGLGTLAVGITSTFQGTFRDASRWLEQSASLLLPDRVHALQPLMDMNLHLPRSLMQALGTWCRGYPDQALSIVKAAMRQVEVGDAPENLAVAHLAMGIIRLLRREALQSRPHIQQIWTLLGRSRIPLLRFYFEYLDGWEKLERRLIAEATGVLESFVAYLQDNHAYLSLTVIHGNLARAYAGSGALEKGLGAIQRALALAEETGERYWEAELYRIQGEILAQQGHMPRAESSLDTALAVARRQGAKSWELRAATSLARLWQRQGKLDEARQVLAQIYGWFTEGFDTRDLQEAKTLLDELS